MLCNNEGNVSIALMASTFLVSLYVTACPSAILTSLPA